ncbi:LytTR family transcriptional regulator DNA-binding domain-containing protein [Ponticoccus sp. SC2-23]|uniref:LytTR family DNA-binding domain-containing protein n=1 Tax=Alexandriicola marinus TaxID=2081710 RepID=UPI000FD8BA98|nr:LytTR family DNA-binding domain-containing protein [Alexandriicola marinus]MBM1218560.1 LytTR family transcriptional regulator DNA-binding domain-containing protein [Ponticoccus sp. SC6-9]MBM1224368.1 LytTR family transcriptional regulator DNA-binding domain-containing protein [Ponticoccus sp. SC6-15]MBM1229852.1 LytTR family transcriptional regulator DNA-binding domain-containing protein [Ponticoccus sp. SC6-38]MBM1233334.1 LytTR family transcriptional regulator DNA-binding domain-containin
MREKVIELATDRKILIFLILVIGFTILGPFGTYELFDPWARLVFWSVVITGIGALMHFGIVLALKGAGLQSLPWPVRIAIGAMVAAVPSVGVVIFVTAFMFETGVSPGAFPVIWLQVAVIGTLAGIVEYKPPSAPPEPEPERPVTTRFHKRLPEGAPHDIVSLSMNDHYVEVTTTEEQHLVLVRFSDALDELDELDGLRLHRSHWAARAHLRSLIKRGRQLRAVLSDGRELPVSNSYAGQLQDILELEEV